jgi:hypothetical protein
MMYRTGRDDYPIFVGGTGFMVGFHRRAFLITAAHVLQVHGVTDASQVVVYPSDTARTPVKLLRLWTCEDPDNDSDSSDLAIMQIDVRSIGRRKRAHCILSDLTHPHSTANIGRYTRRYFFFGYPKEYMAVDYDAKHVASGQVFFQGNYAGEAPAKGVHRIEFANPRSVPDINGMSGSPVYSIPNVIGPIPDGAGVFSGMAIRGSATRGIIHFLDSETIRLALITALGQAA